METVSRISGDVMKVETVWMDLMKWIAKVDTLSLFLCKTTVLYNNTLFKLDDCFTIFHSLFRSLKWLTQYSTGQIFLIGSPE